MVRLRPPYRLFDDLPEDIQTHRTHLLCAFCGHGVVLTDRLFTKDRRTVELANCKVTLFNVSIGTLAQVLCNCLVHFDLLNWLREHISNYKT